ncbi:hypothetical protein ASPFODRAFT_374864 [Aspergillus luchuensis CBS 106.47]|uniref:Uncharacterized protein n=1 Tax=Aspergillus luchuensis (strain CBS 106.47) TaxID=1137211 RepID=A0A1M3T408_ASPLC|nr:hypothetical protein ASPFODRAFT_374864 [Aspergillus luchuensis CBS 106.47]
MLSSIRFWPGRFAKTLARYMLLLLSTLWGCALVTVFFIMLCVRVFSQPILHSVALCCVAGSPVTMRRETCDDRLGGELCLVKLW